MAVDGLGFEEVNQAVTSTAIVSGTNVYGATSVRSPLVVGANISGTTAVRGAAVYSTIGQLNPAGTGSPTSWGLTILAGSANASNAAVTVTFGTAFRAIPAITVTPAGSTTIAGTASGASATAFGLLGTSGMLHFWTAVGSI